MTCDNTVLSHCRYCQSTCDDAAHLFHLPAQPEDEWQKRQAASEQRGISCLFPCTHSGTQVLLRLVEVTGPQEADAKRKVRESHLVLVSCLLDCRQCSAAIRDCFFRDHVTITGGVSRYHRQEKLDALLWCAMLFHDGLSLLDHSSHFVYRSSYWQ